MPSRRSFLASLMASAGVPALQLFAKGQSRRSVGPINRVSLVRRHNPINIQIDPLSALSVGDGRFAFGGDVTGLQTLEQEYEKTMPLCKMWEWGWHTIPKPTQLAN